MGVRKGSIFAAASLAASLFAGLLIVGVLFELAKKTALLKLLIEAFESAVNALVRVDADVDQSGGRIPQQCCANVGLVPCFVDSGFACTQGSRPSACLDYVIPVVRGGSAERRPSSVQFTFVTAEGASPVPAKEVNKQDSVRGIMFVRSTEGAQNLMKHGSVGVTLLCIGCSIGLGSYLARGPWDEYREQQRQTNMARKELRKVEDQRADLIRQTTRNSSRQGEEELLRERGHHRTNERPLYEVLDH